MGLCVIYVKAFRHRSSVSAQVQFSCQQITLKTSQFNFSNESLNLTEYYLSLIKQKIIHRRDFLNASSKL